jgi:protease II
LEYDEFGDPRHRLADLSFWVRHSPVTNVPPGGLPALMILCRTGLNDTQVYAYEPLKWILKSRGPSPAPSMPKLLGIAIDQGHFYSGATELDARATDLAILDAFIGRYTASD